TNSRSNGNQFQDMKLMPLSANQPAPCPLTIPLRLSVPDTSNTVMNTKPMANSYDTICAAPRNAPSNAYLELDAQPATMTPYTPSDVIAITYNKPAFTLARTISGPKGMTAQAANAGIRVTTGASTNKTLLDLAGMITSLVRSLNTSAKGCNKPR